MAAKRVKGQETEFRIVVDGIVQDIFRATSTWSFTDQLEVLDEGYIGETTNRKDSVYNGTDFSLEAHFEDAGEMDLRTALIARARREGGAVVRVDIGDTLLYPNGTTRTVTLLDCEFGNIEISAGSRSEYVMGSFEGSCSETQVFG